MKRTNLKLQQIGTQWQSALADATRPSNHSVKSESGFDYNLIKNGSCYKDSC